MLLSRLFRRPSGRKAIEHADALLHAGIADRQAGRWVDAERSLRAALSRSPDSVEARVQLGVLLASSGRLDDALPHLERAIALDPTHAFARMNYANACRQRGRTAESLEHYRVAVRAEPALRAAWGNMLRPLLDTLAWEEAQQAFDRLFEFRDRDPSGWARYVQPMDALLLDLPIGLQREIAEHHARRAAVDVTPITPLPLAKRDRIRIGYLSRDFRNHAVGQLARALVRHRDRARFEVYVYSFGRDDGSHYRAEFVEAADRFTDIAAESPSSSAQRIARDGVDILVDLGGHTTQSRLGILAARPAPVTAHYLGYPGTLGADYVDYYLTDAVASPPESDTAFAEALVRLPTPFMVSDPDQPLIDRPMPRRAAGLPDGVIVFCAFHQSAKITAEVLDAWMQILAAVPDSVLWLKQLDGEAKLRVEAAATRRGVAAERIRFADNLTKKKAHLERMAAADVFLDTFGRYNGHSTINEALWVGLPVVTLAGDRFAARVAASLMAGAGVADLVSTSRASYVSGAIALALDSEHLESVSARIRAAQAMAPLFDPARVVGSIERAYAEMLARCRAGTKPSRFALE